MAYTKAGKDLEAEVVERAVRALQLTGYNNQTRSKSRYEVRLGRAELQRVLNYLKERFLQ